MKWQIEHRKTVEQLEYFDAKTEKQRCSSCSHWLGLIKFPKDEMKILGRGRRCSRCCKNRKKTTVPYLMEVGAKTMKVTTVIPINTVSKIDKLVADGVYVNRSDFIRIALLSKLELKHTLKDGSNTDLP